MFIPFCRHSVAEDEATAVLDALHSDWLTTGPKTREFERDFANYIGVQHAVALNSCTAALHLALLAHGVSPGDEVITTPLTFCATAEAIEYCGAHPVFVDVDPGSFNIDANLIEASISARTRCILPVHYGGIPCELEAIYRIADRHNLLVIEDAAHALGSRYHNEIIGSFGKPACFSFYATKNITTGEGGMVTLNDSETAEKIKLLGLHGMSKDAWRRYSKHGTWRYEINELGYKYNMPDMQAALGICQLKKLETFNSIRQKRAKMYFEILRECEEVSMPAWYDDYFLRLIHSGTLNSWHLFVILLNEDRVTINRDRLIEELKEQGIGTSVHFIPLHLQPYYARKYGFRRGRYPVAESIFERVVSLPIYPRLTEQDILFITERLQKILCKHRK
ncbi:MAG: DegT/DnrJ/EryC1/StrS family aminotransferase [bacterium]